MGVALQDLADQVFQPRLGVDLGGRDAGMPQYGLYVDQRERGIGQHPRGGGVTEIVQDQLVPKPSFARRRTARIA
ncbi:hypothetical protein TUM20985_21240 [Mycobacterium antarcticum]|nr:hypothetical protein TUM20985_21240 [Mycolicibacterium sp. TUM20985]